jgi:hypothetical protein
MRALFAWTKLRANPRVAAVQPDRQAVVHVRVPESGQPARCQRERAIELALQHLALELFAQRLAHLDLDRREAIHERVREREPALASPGERQPEDELSMGLLRLADRERILGRLDAARLVEQPAATTSSS